MTLDQFLNKVNWHRFDLSQGDIRAQVSGRTHCPLQDVFGYDSYGHRARLAGLPSKTVNLIMEAADTGSRKSWSLRKRMLRRMKNANPYAYNGPNL